MVYLSHQAELTVRLDICRKVSRAMDARGCDRVVTPGLSSLGTQSCLNAGAVGMVVTPHARSCQHMDMPAWRWCGPSTP